jgi:hypothetical protein
MQFEAGKTYYAHAICDHDTIYSFEILRRTAKTVWVEVHGEVVKRRVSVDGGVESFMPFGSYSMAACISADRPLITEDEAVEEVTEEAAPVTPAYEVIAEVPALEPVAFHQPAKAKATSVKLTRAEGPTAALMTVEITPTYQGEVSPMEQASSILRMWAAMFPPYGRSVDKVDFWITFDDGEVYAGTFLLEASHRLGADLQAHIESYGEHLRGDSFYAKALAERDEFMDTRDLTWAL